MAVGEVALQIDSHAALARISATFGAMPQAVARAVKRALRKLATWLKRQVLRSAAAASQVPQKFFQVAMRYHVVVTDQGLSVWIGTNEIKAHRLGPVVWKPFRGAGSRPRTMPKAPARALGARVGRRSFPNSWSWGEGSATGPAVMYRRGDERLPIDIETVPIHQQILDRLSAMQPETTARFDRLLTQELNYALRLENLR